jgi:hypothetical protein
VIKVICCYVNLHPKTRESIENYAPNHEFIDVSSDDFAYWRALKANWNQGHDLMVVEQDNAINPDTVANFDACEDDWCVCPYYVLNQGGKWGDVIESLGCVRFSAVLQSRVKVVHLSPDDYRHWRQVAPRFAATLTRYGYISHIHEEHVEHFHDRRDYMERIGFVDRAAAKNMDTQEYKDAMMLPANSPSFWTARRVANWDKQHRSIPGKPAIIETSERFMFSRDTEEADSDT